MLVEELELDVLLEVLVLGSAPRCLAAPDRPMLGRCVGLACATAAELSVAAAAAAVDAAPGPAVAGPGLAREAAVAAATRSPAAAALQCADGALL